METPSPFFQHTPRQKFGGIVAVALLVSFVIGALAGGIFGAITGSLVSSGKFLKNRTASTSTTDAGTTSLTLNDVEENSATIKAVGDVSPAVVSIILTQDLSKLPKQSFQTPFGDFFSPLAQQQGERQVGAGSGFIVTSDGMILTNRHVADSTGVDFTVIFEDGSKHPAKVLAIDPFNDLAILKIDGKDLPTVTLGDSSKLQLGETVIAIGNALELQNSVTKGIISGVNRTVTAGDSQGQAETIEEAIQTDAAINPGNSGGPLINLAGHVIGVNTAVNSQGQLQGFAIPINVAKQVIESVQKYGKVVRPYLGVRYTLVTEDVKNQNDLSVDYGALIVGGSTASQSGVIKDSPADKAGLAENDIILTFNGEKITTEKSLSSFMQMAKVGDVVALTVLHEEKQQEVKVTLEEYQQSSE